MRRPFVAGNWKMHGTRMSMAVLLEGIQSGLRSGGASDHVDVVVCPPAVYLLHVQALLKNSSVACSAQNLSHEKAGAFTGEVSAEMLVDVGCKYVIVGHSERRALYGESDVVVAKKYAAAQAAGLVPILCVGERLEERESGATEAVVARQLDAILSSSGVASLARAVIAYEPVWAIGTGRTASPQQAQDVHVFIRTRVRAQDVKVADTVRVVYGGSVKASNAVEIFQQPDVDGGLIGGASLQAEEFLAICRAAK